MEENTQWNMISHKVAFPEIQKPPQWVVVSFFFKQMQRLLLHYTKLIDDATPGDWSQQRHQ